MNPSAIGERIRQRQIRRGDFPISVVERNFGYTDVRSNVLPTVVGEWCFLDGYAWPRDSVSVESSNNGVYRIRIDTGRRI